MYCASFFSLISCLFLFSFRFFFSFTIKTASDVEWHASVPCQIHAPGVPFAMDASARLYERVFPVQFAVEIKCKIFNCSSLSRQIPPLLVVFKGFYMRFILCASLAEIYGPDFRFVLGRSKRHIFRFACTMPPMACNSHKLSFASWVLLWFLAGIFTFRRIPEQCSDELVAFEAIFEFKGKIAGKHQPSILSRHPLLHTAQ